MVHVAYGEFLESENRIDEAEKEYIIGNHPTSAIDMRLRRKEWESAIRISSEYDNSQISKVFLSQGEDMEQHGDLANAEDLYMRGNRPDKSIDMYIENKRFEEAIRIAKDFAPQRIKEITMTQMTGEERGGEKVAKMLEVKSIMIKRMQVNLTRQLICT